MRWKRFPHYWPFVMKIHRLQFTLYQRNNPEYVENMGNTKTIRTDNVLTIQQNTIKFCAYFIRYTYCTHVLSYEVWWRHDMDAFRITDPLWQETAGHMRIPSHWPSDVQRFFISLNTLLSSWRWIRHHCNEMRVPDKILIWNCST